MNQIYPVPPILALFCATIVLIARTSAPQEPTQPPDRPLWGEPLPPHVPSGE